MSDRDTVKEKLLYVSWPVKPNHKDPRFVREESATLVLPRAFGLGRNQSKPLLRKLLTPCKSRGAVLVILAEEIYGR